MAVVDLVVLSGSRAGARFSIPEIPIVVGRSPEANVHIDDPWISNMHALIEKRGGELWVVDLGSRNGTFVDEQRVAEARVAPGMALAFGRTRFELQIRTATSVPDSDPVVAPIQRTPVGVTVPHQARLRPYHRAADQPEGHPPQLPAERPVGSESRKIRAPATAARKGERRGPRSGSKPGG
jgi:pSer/pThr/pTyr-binding forkhead associated (FHA) protein